jgi:hypothetical protein
MKALAVSIFHFSFVIFHLPSPAFIGRIHERVLETNDQREMENDIWKMNPPTIHPASFILQTTSL